MNDTVYSLFSHQVSMHPDFIACRDECRYLSYAGLAMLADSIAFKFPNLKSRRVGIVCDHSVEMIAAILAVLKLGAAYVPVEPSFPDKRIRFIMEECKVDFVITNPQYESRFDYVPTLTIEQGEAITCPDVDNCDLRLRNSRRDLREAKPDDVAYILYTSGTTGRPKGVQVTNRNVCHYVRAFNREFHPGPGDVMMQYSVCSFDIFVEEVFTTLLTGATLAIPSNHTKADMKRLLSFIDRKHITIISGFPYLLIEFNKLRRLPDSIRLLISGGDVLRLGYVDHLLSQVPVYNTYGPSETTVCASYYRCDARDAAPDGSFPIGHPVAGTDIRICDDNLDELPAGVEGEICIMGGGVSKGYIGNRRKENKAFVSLKDGRRLYRSGDLGMRLPDGTLIFHHRKDSQVMILGRRVETAEVESVICRCAEVESGVVVDYTDNKGLSFLVAYIVPKDPANFSKRDLRKEMSEYLPEYMLPEFIVAIKKMPLTANGKPDLHALPVVEKTNTFL